MAGGFGIGNSASKFTGEVAPVVPYRDGHTAPDGVPVLDDDIEAGDVKRKVSSSHSSVVEEGDYSLILSSETPFFHMDLAGAVRAAESGLDRLNERKSREQLIAI